MFNSSDSLRFEGSNQAVENFLRGGKAPAIEGLSLAFDYPSSNYRGTRQRLERRRITVKRVRDLAVEPLDPVTLQLDPLLKRDGYLVTGHDWDRGAERSFWSGSMANVEVISAESEAGTSEESGQQYQPLAVIIETDDWTPTGPGDIPPTFEIHREPTLSSAIAFAEQFNKLEIERPTGCWCLPAVCVSPCVSSPDESRRVA